ncbi:hypothetical protein RSK20926_15461 [Roseobacter sp. SK209-2-6]|nr:hypothetical protein RSK20926_15461 [Roseobacter sp. SK209-2-6]
MTAGLEPPLSAQTIEASQRLPSAPAAWIAHNAAKSHDFALAASCASLKLKQIAALESVHFGRQGAAFGKAG